MGYMFLTFYKPHKNKGAKVAWWCGFIHRYDIIGWFTVKNANIVSCGNINAKCQMET